MPFVKVGKNKYKSPTGRVLTAKQLRAYYAKKAKETQKKKEKST